MSEKIVNDQHELLVRVAAGDAAAFSRLFHQHSNKVFSFVYSISGSRRYAEDTVQEVFMKIWEKRAETGSIKHFDSYLFAMARNHCFNAFKRMSKETMILAEIREQSEISVDANGIDLKEIELTVRNAVNKLPGRQRQVFMLSREQGMKQSEISQVLNITVPTVKSHMTQAIQFIRKECRNIYPIIKLLFIFFGSFLS